MRIAISYIHRVSNPNGPTVEHYEGSASDLGSLDAARKFLKRATGSAPKTKHDRVEGVKCIFFPRSIWQSVSVYADPEGRTAQVAK
jgi:hypothetical protein